MRLLQGVLLFFRDFVEMGHHACVKKLSSLLIVVCVLSTFFGVESASAQSSANKKLRFDFHAGYSYQNFNGVTGADFSSIGRLNYSAAAFYRFKKYYDAGFQFSLIPAITFSPFIFSDNLVGTYSAKFYQYEFLFGVVKSKLRAHLLVGAEHLSMSGDPVLTYGANLQYYFGGQLSMDFYKHRAIRVPGFLKVLRKGARSFEFTNKPDDTINVKAGLEFVFGTGVDFEFR